MMGCEPGSNCFCATDGVLAARGISALRQALSRGSQAAAVLLLGSVVVHGLCTADSSRESARYRSLFARLTRQALPSRNSRNRFALDVGGCQLEPRLACVCGFGPNADEDRAAVVCR